VCFCSTQKRPAWAILKLVASKEGDVDRKTDLIEKAWELLSIDELDKVSSDCKMEKLEKTARDCSQIFQRSRSCVEGRNAQLALRHQGIHQLSNRHLEALAVVHNYYVRRRDGTTAAERFFEAKPNDLFEIGNSVFLRTYSPISYKNFTHFSNFEVVFSECFFIFTSPIFLITIVLEMFLKTFTITCKLK
jgi:hypothetical protein